MAGISSFINGISFLLILLGVLFVVAFLVIWAISFFRGLKTAKEEAVIDNSKNKKKPKKDTVDQLSEAFSKFQNSEYAQAHRI